LSTTDVTNQDAVHHFPTTVARGHAIVWLSGELDILAAPALRAALADAIDRAGTGVIADLSRVSFIDASTLGVLVGAGNNAGHLPAGLCLSGVPAHADRLLRITGLLGSLPSVSSPVPAARRADPASLNFPRAPRPAKTGAALATSH
jgi:anti-sigma B factor antagonist